VGSSSINVEKLLRNLGIEANRSGIRWVAKCPNPKHDDSEPSWSIIDTPGRDKHGSQYCFACKFGGGPWELAAAVWKVSVEEAGARIRERGIDERTVPKASPVVIFRSATRPVFTLPPFVVIPEPGGKWYQPALDYLLNDRGMTMEQVEKYGVGYCIKGRFANRVFFPVRDSAGTLLTYTARAIVKTMVPRYSQGLVSHGADPRPAIWGEAQWRGTETVTVAEGNFSALALERAGAPNVCAILGSDVTPEKRLKLSKFRRYLIATDPDPAGEKAARVIAETFRRRSPVERLGLRLSPDDMPHDELAASVRDALQKLKTVA
jgi:hypothetical protein